MTTGREEPQPGLRERKKSDSRRGIRDAAYALFAEHGYEAVSVEQIASSAGVSRTTYFNYFPSKEAVIFDPDPADVELQRRLREARPTDEPLWTSLTSVIVDTLETGRGPMVQWRHLVAASPTLTQMIHKASEALLLPLRTWVERRGSLTGDDQQAQLQFAVALAAVTTAFRQWRPDDGTPRLAALTRGHFDQLAPAFISADHDSSRRADAIDDSNSNAAGPMTGSLTGEESTM